MSGKMDLAAIVLLPSEIYEIVRALRPIVNKDDKAIEPKSVGQLAAALVVACHKAFYHLLPLGAETIPLLLAHEPEVQERAEVVEKKEKP
jgi:hypothetical protein